MSSALILWMRSMYTTFKMSVSLNFSEQLEVFSCLHFTIQLFNQAYPLNDEKSVQRNNTTIHDCIQLFIRSQLPCLVQVDSLRLHILVYNQEFNEAALNIVSNIQWHEMNINMWNEKRNNNATIVLTLKVELLALA